MVKLPRTGRMAIAAGIGTIALLGTAAQAASAAPAPTPSASAVRAAPSRAALPARPASASDPNCAYEVVTGTDFMTDAGRRNIELSPGELLWGPQSNVIGQSSAYLYSLDYQVYGWVWTGALYEQYCDE